VTKNAICDPLPQEIPVNETVVRTTVPTYDGTYGASQRPSRGHGHPQVAVAVEFGQGIDIDLAPDKDDVDATIYIERRHGGWYLNVSPDGGDAKLDMIIGDKGGIAVHDDRGRTVYEVPFPEPTPEETPQ
jgi:hypothetical protein